MRIPPLPIAAEPMWYAAGPAVIERRGGPLARRLAAACHARWGPHFAIDLQVVGLGPGSAAAPPVPRPIHSPAWKATGPDDDIALLIEAERPIVAAEVPLPHDGQPFFVPALTAVRGLPQPGDGARIEAVMAIGRRVEPSERFDRRRRSARAFVQGNRITPSGAPMPDYAADRSLVFHSALRTIGRLPTFTDAEIGREPIPDLCRPRWVLEHGGPIARAFVRALPRKWLDDPDAVIVGRINELSPGWASCWAGWHFDGTSRFQKRPDGCPDLANPGVHIENVVCSVGRTGMTACLVGEIAMPDIPLGVPRGEVRPHQQRVIADLVEQGRVTEMQARPFDVVLLQHGDFHDCRPSHEPGWRFFIKAMRGRKDPVHNRFHEIGQLGWLLAAGHWPDDPLGVFPTALPNGVGPD